MYKSKKDIQEEYNIQTGENLIDVDVQNRPHRQLARNAEIIYEGTTNIGDQAGIEYSSDPNIYNELPDYLSNNYLEDGMSVKRAIRMLDKTLYNIFTMTVTASPSGGDEEEDDTELKLGYDLKIRVSSDPIFDSFSSDLKINPEAIDCYKDRTDLNKFRIACGFYGQSEGYSRSSVKEIEGRNNGEEYSLAVDTYLVGGLYETPEGEWEPLKFYMYDLTATSWGNIHVATLCGFSDGDNAEKPVDEADYKYKSITVTYYPDAEEIDFNNITSSNLDEGTRREEDRLERSRVSLEDIYSIKNYLLTSGNDLYYCGLDLSDTEELSIFRKWSSDVFRDFRKIYDERTLQYEGSEDVSMFMFESDGIIFVYFQQSNSSAFYRIKSYDKGYSWSPVEPTVLPIQFDSGDIGIPTTLKVENGDVLLAYLCRINSQDHICAALGTMINEDIVWYKTAKREINYPYVPNSTEFKSKKIPLIQTSNNGSMLGFLASEPEGVADVSKIYKVTFNLE